MKFRPPPLLPLLAILPFLVGFTPPEEEGSHVSFSAGRGRFLSSGGCHHPQVVEFTDQQAGIYQVRKFKSDRAPRLGVGADLNAIQSREKECTEKDCANGDPGWESNPPHVTLSPYATLDWTWVGLGLGAILPLRGLGDIGGNQGDGDVEFMFPLRGRLRIGPTDRFYGTYEILAGQPMHSGLVIPIGIGGRLLGFDLWGSALGFTGDEPGASLAVARRFGRVRMRLSGTYIRTSDRFSNSNGDFSESFTVEYPRQTISAGIDYHIPW